MTKIAYSMPEAAEEVSLGVEALENAAKRGELTRRYPSSKPIVLHDDLIDWVRSLPTEKPERA